METTGADANDEFARWLAETAKPGGTADQAQPVQPGAPPGVPATPPPAPPQGAMPPSGQPAPPSPEFFGADELASPPTRPYEAPFAGPQVARTSFQPAAGDPPLPPAPPPATPPATQPAAPAAPEPPAGPDPAAPAWAPGYAGPQAAPAPGTSFFPSAEPPAGFPPAPPASPAPPSFAPLDVPPAFGDPAAPAPAAPDAPAPGAPVPPAAPPAAPEPPAAPPEPAAPSYGAPYAQPSPVPPGPPAVPASDPFAPLFDAGSSDVAARLAASPPPSMDAPPVDDPPLAAPPEGERPSDEDPLSALFGGLQTAEAPVAPTADLFASTPVAPEPPVYVPEAAFTVEPTLPPAPTALAEPEPVYEPAVAPPAPSSAPAGQAYNSEPPPDDDPTAGTQFFGGGSGEYEDPPDLDRTSAGEKAAFVLAFLVPPVGLIGSIVAAAQSSRRRGWVHPFVRAGLVISIVTTIVAGVAGAYGYKVLEDERRHAALEAASTQFCATVAEQPDLISPPTFGFPGPGASIPETIEGIQAYIDRWDALAAVSPSGIRPDVTRVSDAARDILETIESTRLVNNEQNVANMTTVAESTGIVAWHAEYC